MGDILAVRSEYRLREWAGVIEQCRASGLSNRAYCAQCGISEKTYYYWLRRVRTVAAGAVGARLVEVAARDLEGEGAHPDMVSLRYQGAELTVCLRRRDIITRGSNHGRRIHQRVREPAQ